MALSNRGIRAGDYLTADGKLTKPLEAEELQGGFAGNTGVHYSIAADGSWTSQTVFNKKLTPKDKGKLSKEELAKLAALLVTYDLATLPEKTGKATAANPRSIELTYGDQKASYIGQRPPELDAKNPAGTPESRFAGIWQGLVGLLKPAKK